MHGEAILVAIVGLEKGETALITIFSRDTKRAVTDSKSLRSFYYMSSREQFYLFVTKSCLKGIILRKYHLMTSDTNFALRWCFLISILDQFKVSYVKLLYIYFFKSIYNIGSPSQCCLLHRHKIHGTFPSPQRDLDPARLTEHDLFIINNHIWTPGTTKHVLRKTGNVQSSVKLVQAQPPSPPAPAYIRLRSIQVCHV